MNFRFLHAADLHLDSPLRGLARYEGAPAEELRGATREALKNLVGLALEEEVDFVILAGDLYDGDWKDFNTGLFLIQRLRELAEAGIPVFAIKGNHDAESKLSRSLTLPDTVTMFSHKRPETARLDDLQVALHGQSFAHSKTVEDLCASYPAPIAQYFNIGLLHTSADGREGHANYAPCSVAELKGRGYDYWALGHVHQREVLSEDPWIVFPGNVQGRHIREVGSKGATLVTVEEGQVAEVEHRPLDVVRWHRLHLDLEGCGSASDVLTLVSQELRALCEDAEGRLLAVRVDGRGACGAHRELQENPERWENEIRSLAGDRIWVEKVRLRSRSTVSPEELAERDDAFAALLTGIRQLEGDPEAVAALGTRLFVNLESKLPLEVREGEDGIRPTDPDYLRELLPEVSSLLASRLTRQAGHAP